MALRYALCLSRATCSTSSLQLPLLAVTTTIANNGRNRGQRGHHGGGGKDHRRQGRSWGGVLGLGAAATGAVAVAAGAALPNSQLSAAEDLDQDVIDHENRIRQFSTGDTIFDYFATYQMQGGFGSTLDTKNIMMSVKDFYNAVTPGSTITHGVGRGVYTILEPHEIGSAALYEEEHLPIPGESVLNKIQKEGMLTYCDFCFLLHILSTPRRYMDIAFHAFDVSADGNVEAKEYAYVIATISNYKGSRDELVTDTNSGLMNVLFGKDRTKEMVKEDFLQLQRDLIHDVLWMEFSRYSKDGGKTISEVDFATHLVANAGMPKKKKKAMVKRVKNMVGAKGSKAKGVSFANFKAFYHVLFGGCDLERAMFFLNNDKRGVNSAEFLNIAKWVANKDIDPYIVDIIFELLDEDGDRRLSIKEFGPVLFQWRHSRGFHQSSLQVSLGQLKMS